MHHIRGCDQMPRSGAAIRSRHGAARPARALGLWLLLKVCCACPVVAKLRPSVVGPRARLPLRSIIIITTTTNTNTFTTTPPLPPSPSPPLQILPNNPSLPPASRPRSVLIPYPARPHPPQHCLVAPTSPIWYKGFRSAQLRIFASPSNIPALNIELSDTSLPPASIQQ